MICQTCKGTKSTVIDSREGEKWGCFLVFVAAMLIVAALLWWAQS